MRLHQITPELVDLAPRELQPGRLYISNKYRAAVHLCCCGCGEKVVTPLSPAEWQVEVSHGRATLHPSIGNGAMACMSHYIVRNNRVIWFEPLSEMQAKRVFDLDQRDLDRLYRAEGSVTNAHNVSPTTELPEARTVSWWGRLIRIWRWLTT